MSKANLNEMQQLAVERTQGPVLILAGAGSGKTSTLTARIAHILEMGLAKPHEILAITFTNKAAAEMRERVGKLTGGEAANMQLSTFHSFCCKILRENITELGYTRWFSIYDDDDSMSVITAIAKDMDLSDKYYPRRAIRAAISDAKNKLLSPDEYKQQSDDARADKIAVVYSRYEEQLKASNSLDFDDLLTKVLELFAERPEILRWYQQRFKYIHVDEYQDTNRAQYLLVKLLCDHYRNICVVGDDDQSIYGWRGADINNILDFEKDFPDAFVIRLEQNYRSTSKVLDAANAVIANNTARKDKHLWTEKQGGEKVTIYTAESERDEAAYCARTINQLLGEYRYGDMAVLYRTNAQSRAIEDALMKFGIAYNVYGGTRFYDRKEVKDVVAYLKLASNPFDTVAIKRVINVPRRGIGDTTIEKLDEAASRRSVTLWEILKDPDAVRDAAPKAAKQVHDFVAIIKAFEDAATHMALLEFVDKVLGHSGLVAMYEEADDDESRNRLENIKEFRSAAADFMMNRDETNLNEFLENIALVTDLDNMDGKRASVTMMTLHSAKGLEFPVVFLPGMEEGIFPTSRSFDDPEKLEEERRLAYVGITRAKDRLYLLHSLRRLLYGNISDCIPSRFLDEIPEELVMHRGEATRKQRRTENARPFFERSGAGYDFGSRVAAPERPKRPAPAPVPAPRTPNFGATYPSRMEASRTQSEPRQSAGDLAPGMMVRHKLFGEGIIVGIDGNEPKRIFKINFKGVGIKELSESYAPLEKV
jgi:DNA helicase II / ATP-dependent DNA helicase PcrA